MNWTGKWRWCILVLAIVTIALTAGAGAVLAQEEGAQEAEGVSWFMLLYQGGFIAWIIMAVSVVLIALVIDNFIKIRRDVLVPPGIEDKVAQCVQQRRLDQLVTLVRGTDSYITRILIKGLAEIQGGYLAMKQAMEEAGEEETIRLNQRIQWLATIGNISPMLGLFGTVLGMIMAFQTLGTMTNVDASALANDIFVALITTFLGLAVAIPAIFCYTIFRNRIVLYSLEVGGFCEQFLRLLRRVYGTQLSQAAATAIPAKGQQGAKTQTGAQQTPPPQPAQQQGQQSQQGQQGQGGQQQGGQPPMIQPLPPQQGDQGNQNQ